MTQLSSNVQEAVTGEVVHFDACIDKDGDIIEKSLCFFFYRFQKKSIRICFSLIKQDGNFVQMCLEPIPFGFWRKALYTSGLKRDVAKSFNWGMLP